MFFLTNRSTFLPWGSTWLRCAHTSLGPPMWASVARGDANVRVEKTTCPESPPAITAAEFLVLFERCMTSGLKARMVISHAARCQAITVMSSLPASTETTTAVLPPSLPPSAPASAPTS